jgi:hypothetical protein
MRLRGRPGQSAGEWTCAALQQQFRLLRLGSSAATRLVTSTECRYCCCDVCTSYAVLAQVMVADHWFGKRTPVTQRGSLVQWLLL